MDTLRCTLRSIRYSGSGYWSVATAIDTDGDLCTIVGPLVCVSEGDSIELTGKWVDDPKWGSQYKFSKCEIVSAESSNGVLSWLTTMPHVGRARAMRIVERFGDAVFSVIESDPHQLTCIDGITGNRADEIRVSYLERKSQRDAMIFLRRIGLTDYQAGTIMLMYGADGAESAIRDNPYRLCELRGFGFRTVDKIALRAGIASDHVERGRACVAWILSEAAGCGHCYMTLVEIRDAAARVGVSAETISRSLHAMIEDRSVILVDERDIYLTRYRDAETMVADRLSKLIWPEST